MNKMRKALTLGELHDLLNMYMTKDGITPDATVLVELGDDELCQQLPASMASCHPARNELILHVVLMDVQSWRDGWFETDEETGQTARHEWPGQKLGLDDTSEDLKRLLALMMVVHNGNLGDTQAEFEHNVSTICGWDEDRTKHAIQEAATEGLIERTDSLESS